MTTTLLTACLVIGTLCSPVAVRVVDGDTVVIAGERIRLKAIDAPETHPSRCPAEVTVGAEATAMLTRLLDGARIVLDRHGRDRYGRTLANIKTGAGDVAAALMADGLAVPWKPGPVAWEERRQHWCGK